MSDVWDVMICYKEMLKICVSQGRLGSLGCVKCRRSIIALIQYYRYYNNNYKKEMM